MWQFRTTFFIHFEVRFAIISASSILYGLTWKFKYGVSYIYTVEFNSNWHSSVTVTCLYLLQSDSSPRVRSTNLFTHLPPETLGTTTKSMTLSCSVALLVGPPWRLSSSVRLEDQYLIWKLTAQSENYPCGWIHCHHCPLWYSPSCCDSVEVFFLGAAHCVNQKWIWKTITKSGNMPHSGMEHCVCPLSHSPMISQFCGGFFGCWSLPTSKVNLEDNYQIRKHATWWDGLCSIEIVKIIECWTICGGCNTFQMQKVKWTRLVAVLTLKHTHFCLFSFSKNWPSFLKFRCAKCH